MSDFSWLKQTAAKPLFEDLLWSRPENKRFAGRLLIVGGNINGFRAPATVYNQAQRAGAGVISVLLPESLKSTVGQSIEDTVFCPANKSGSLSRQALAEILAYAEKSDLSLLAGDFGHNSETTILIESFASKYNGLLCLNDDALDPFMADALRIFNRPKTLIVASLAKLQKLLNSAKFDQAITSSMDLIKLVELLSKLTSNRQLSVVTYHQSQLIVSSGGQASITKVTKDLNDWDLVTSAYCSVWWLQNKSKAFESLTTGIHQSINI